MNSAFSEQILADKLSKLNSTQQCIETLSHWCIFHRKNAEQVVQTWEKQFNNSQKEQKISFLYLANDILQNSKRTGNEFVGEFWKVLPAAVKDVTENGDDHGKNVVSRLVNIWEERRVFGSRARGLDNLMLGSEPLPALELNKKRSRSGSVKIMKRDSRSIKLKLSIGGTAEKIVSALHTVLTEHPEEDTDLDNCKTATRRLEKMEKDVDIACARVGDPRRATLAVEIQEEETSLKQCMEKIKSVEANRAALVSELKEALQEQESQLESVRTQLQIAQGQLEQAANMRRRLNNEPIVPLSKLDSNGPSTTPSDSKKTAAAIAAEVADRLAKSTHSQQIMTSVLSTFAAEEAKNANLTTPSSTSNSRPALEKQMSVPETTTAASTSTFVPVQPQAVLLQQAPLQNQQSPVPQPQYNIFTTSNQQYLQPPPGMMIGLPYTFTPVPQPPPPPPPAPMMSLQRPQQMSIMQQPAPPPPPHMVMHHQQMPPLNQQQVQFSMQQPPPPSYRPLQPPGMGFYPHQPQ